MHHSSKVVHCIYVIKCNYSVYPVIPSQCRNTGVGIRLFFMQFAQFRRIKRMRIATPVTSVT